MQGFTGNTKILTQDEYHPLSVFAESHIAYTFAYGGDLVYTKILESSSASVVRVMLEYGWGIECTPEQVFLLDDGCTRCAASQLKGKLLKRTKSAFKKYPGVLVTDVEDAGEKITYVFSLPVGYEWGDIEGFVVQSHQKRELK